MNYPYLNHVAKGLHLSISILKYYIHVASVLFKNNYHLKHRALNIINRIFVSFAITSDTRMLPL